MTLRLLASLLFIISFAACVNDDEPAENWALKPGDNLPVFSVTTLDGMTVDNGTFSDKKGYIIFFSTTCSDCRREMPAIEEAYRRYMADPGKEELEIICISRDDDEAAIGSFIKEFGLTMPVAVDNGRRVYSKFASGGVPRVFVVDNGIITASYLELLLSDKTQIH